MADTVRDEIYDVHADVEALAQYLTTRYGNLENALRQFDADAELNEAEFEAWLRKWGLVDKVDAIGLFDYIDRDVSFTISVHELFGVLKLPADQIKQRQKEQHDKEMQTIFAAFATGIREFGTIEEYFANQLKHGALLTEDAKGERRFVSPKAAGDPGGLVPRAGGMPSPEKGLDSDGGPSLSFAQFLTFADKLKIGSILNDQLASRCLQRAFQELDKDCDEKVSIAELKAALRVYIVRDTLVDIATALTQEYESVAGAFVKLAEKKKGLTMSSAAQELKLILRMLCPGHKVVEQDETLQMIQESINPFSIDALQTRLQEEFKRVDKERRDRETKKHEQDEARKERLRRQLHVDASITAGRVNKWVERVANNGADLCRQQWDQHLKGWEESARAGRCRAQLADYVAALEGAIGKSKDDIEKEKKALELAAAARGPDVSQSLGSAAPQLMRLSSTSAAGGTMKHRSKAAVAQRLVQAASCGNIAAVQKMVEDGADVNAVAWGGVTPLMAAAHHGREVVLSRLIELRAALDRTDAHGRTAVDHAFRRPTTRAWLRAHGAPTGEELKLEAEYLAERALELEAERARVAAQRSKFVRAPSRLVRSISVEPTTAATPALGSVTASAPGWPYPARGKPDAGTGTAFSGAYAPHVAQLFGHGAAAADRSHGGYSYGDGAYPRHAHAGGYPPVLPVGAPGLGRIHGRSPRGSPRRAHAPHPGPQGIYKHPGRVSTSAPIRKSLTFAQ